MADEKDPDQDKIDAAKKEHDETVARRREAMKQAEEKARSTK